MDLTHLLNKPINAERFGQTTDRRMILRQDQSPGDILTFTRALCDLKEAYPHFLIDVDTPCPEIFENNPHLTPLDPLDPGVEYVNCRYSSINDSGWRGHHFADAFRIDLEEKLGIPIPSQGLRPQIFISTEEASWYSLIHCEWNWDGPFVVLNAGFKSDNLLKHFHQWPEVAQLFNEHFQGAVKLVQIGHPSHNHPPLPGVLNAVGKTNNLRQLIRLVWHAQAIITPISLPLVLAEAFDAPCVCVAAGKEGPRWQRVNHIRFLDTVGALPCCRHDGCWKGGNMGGCVDLVGEPQHPHCFDMIRPEDVIRALVMYYEGGVLKA